MIAIDRCLAHCCPSPTLARMLSANATPSPPPVANPVSAAPALAESLTVSIVVHRLHRDELLRNLQTLGVAAQRQPATQVRLVLIDNSDASELGEALRALAQQSAGRMRACSPVMATWATRRAQPRHPRVGRHAHLVLNPTWN